MKRNLKKKDSEAIIWMRCQKDLTSHKSCAKAITAHSGRYACCQWGKKLLIVINHNTSVNLCCFQIKVYLIWIYLFFIDHWCLLKEVLFHYNAQQTITFSVLFYLDSFISVCFWSLTQVLDTCVCTFKCSEVAE